MLTEEQIQEVEKDWKSRGYGCDLWSDKAGANWRGFMRDADELVMLLAGELEIRFNGRIFRLVVGDEFIIPAKAFHTVFNNGEEPNKWLCGYKEVA